MKKQLYIVTALLMAASMILASCGTPKTVPATAAPATVAPATAAPATAAPATAAPATAAPATAAPVPPTPTPYPLANCQAGKTCVRLFVGLGGGTDLAAIAVEESIIADFNASQNEIQGILEVIPHAAGRDTLATEIAAGNGPDLVGPVGWAGANEFYGQWLDLAPFIKSNNFDTSIFDPALVSFYQTEEGQVGLPFGIFPGGMYFIPAMFDEQGISYPPQKYGDKYKMPDGTMVDWNWDTVTAIAKLLTVDKNGKNSTEAGFDATQIVQIGYTPQYQSGQSIATFYGGASSIYSGSKGAWKAAIPDSWKAAWQWYYDGMWGKQPFTATGPLASSTEFGGGNVFNSGKAAMGLTQTWYTCCLGDLDKAGVVWQVGIQPIDVVGPNAGKVQGRVDADTIRVWKGTKNPDAAFKFLAYLITTGGDKFLPAMGAMPAISSKIDAFFAAKSAQYPNVTQASWDVFKAGVAYPDRPSAEGWMPGNNTEDSARIGTFINLLQTTSPDKLDFNAEFLKLEDDLTVIFNK
jgi:multiple sugar transport system substrate-binding protein